MHSEEEKKAFTVTKSTVECYKIRHPSGMYWADVTIDASGTTGRIQIASDYGSWQYYWGACGKSFKEFLATLNMDYVAGKFGADNWFDHEKTMQAYRTRIIETRRANYITADQAREMWNEVAELDDYTDMATFQAECWHKHELIKLWDGCPDIETDIRPQFKKFWHGPWQILLQTFKSE